MQGLMAVWEPGQDGAIFVRPWHLRGILDMGDVSYLINYLFRVGAPPPESCD